MLAPTDIQTGNILEGPDGEVRIAGRILTDGGYFAILQPDKGLSGLIQEGTLLDHDEYSLRSVVPSGPGAVQEQAESAAMRGEIDRLNSLVAALMARESTPTPAAPGPAATPEITATDTTETTVPETPAVAPAETVPPAPTENVPSTPPTDTGV